MGSIFRAFEAFAIVMYILLGVFFVSRPQMLDNLPGTYKVVFGILLIFYGIYRTFRFIKKIKSERYETE